jgi:dTDP-4-amino-4,6-dideoxygalactose transaminase
MGSRIHLSAPDVGEAERDAVDRTLRSGWVAPLGPEVDAFEREVATASPCRPAPPPCTWVSAVSASPRARSS